MIKFGRMTHPVNDLRKEIIKANRMNLDYVELGIEPTNSTSLLKNKNNIKNLLKNFPYRPTGHTAWWCDLSSPYDHVRNAWVKQAISDINLAEKLGIKLINFHFIVHSGVLLQNKNSRKLILNNYVKSFRHLLGYASKKKIEVMFENCGEKFEYYKYVIDKVPRLKVHLDIGHAFISGGMKDIQRFFHYFSKKIVHLHIHDNHGKYDEHLPLGKGKINWKKVASLIRRYNYNKTITLEVFTSDKDYLKSKKYFKKLLSRR